MCRPMWRCMVTEAIRSRMVWVITGVLALLVLLALPAKAESADYETTLDRLGRLQALAEQYIEEKNSGDDPIDLTLSFTRVGDYNTTVWQLTAGTRDGEFEKYATDADPDLWDLQGMNTWYTAACPLPAAGAATACSWRRCMPGRPAMQTAMPA